MNLLLDINKDVLEVLQRAQISNSIQLNDLWLSSIQTEAVFKAILHQTNLRCLDLSNNFLQNEGCRQLAKAMPTLKQLRSINISGNFITSDGLEVMLASISNLSGIEEIILSRNPLGNQSLRYLDRFCNPPAGQKTLQKLHIAQCNLTQLYDYDLSYNELIDFDISFNQLTDDSIRTLLTKLNSCRLQNFNLSYVKIDQPEERLASTSGVAAQRLAEFFESGTCEKFKRIALAGWQLCDVDIYKISQCLSRANDLELLDLSDNGRLTSSSMQFIIDKIPHLRKLVATNCTRFLDTDRLERISQLQHIPNFIYLTLGANDAINELNRALAELWHAHWGDRGKIKTFDKNCILYINDKDLSVI